MMRRGRVNPTCKCCNIADDPGWRTREKSDWKKEVEEEMTDNFGLLNDREEAFINAFKEGIRREERNRIIALLEAERWELPDGMPAGGEVYMPIEQAIAIIKENK